MRLLVTGATGFLGRHLIAAAGSHEVYSLTRAAASRSPTEIALGTVWTRANLLTALQQVQPDAVLHCAGVTRADSTRQYFETNTVLAGELMAAAAGLERPPRIVLVGSAAELGFVPEDAQPVTEDFPCAPRNPYGISKYAQTLLALAAENARVPVLVARLFNPVGTGMPAKLALPSFARQLAGPLARSQLVVGDLSPERDFIDAVEAARLLLVLATSAEWRWPLINLCSGKAYRIGTLLDRLVALSGADVQITVDPALVRPGEMRTLVGSTARLEALGLSPMPPDFDRLLPALLHEVAQSSAPPSSSAKG